MPFADVGGAVALFFQHIGQRGLLNPELVLLQSIHVVEDTDRAGNFPLMRPMRDGTQMGAVA